MMDKIEAKFVGKRLYLSVIKCEQRFLNICIIDEINSPNPLIMIPGRLGFSFLKRVHQKIDYIVSHNYPLPNEKIIEIITNDLFP